MLSFQETLVLNEALPDPTTFKDVLGILGVAGGFSVNADASVNVVNGPFQVSAQAGIETGSYQVRFKIPNGYPALKGIAAFQVGGFTPRAAQTAETCEARVTGYNRDSNGEWYISIQIAQLSDNSIDATPPAGFVIGLLVQLQF